MPGGENVGDDGIDNVVTKGAVIRCTCIVVFAERGKYDEKMLQGGRPVVDLHCTRYFILNLVAVEGGAGIGISAIYPVSSKRRGDRGISLRVCVLVVVAIQRAVAYVREVTQDQVVVVCADMGAGRLPENRVSLRNPPHHGTTTIAEVDGFRYNPL